jgi:hypothetical protein
MIRSWRASLRYYYRCHWAGFGRRHRATMRYLKALDGTQRLGQRGRP